MNKFIPIGNGLRGALVTPCSPYGNNEEDSYGYGYSYDNGDGFGYGYECQDSDGDDFNEYIEDDGNGYGFHIPGVIKRRYIFN